jgi:hypothetical protein
VGGGKTSTFYNMEMQTIYGTPKNNIELARKLIRQEFSFLEELGFECVIKALDDKTFIEYTGVEYSDENRKRKVSIRYTKGQVYDEVKYTFTVSITRIPYANNNDYFSLDNYLNSIKEDFSTSMVSMFNEDQAKEILKKLANALKKYSYEIILGNEWLEAYWPKW